MTSTTRIGSTACYKISQANFICMQCRIRATTAVRRPNPPISLSYLSRRHAASSFTDRLRRKLFRSEVPPGAEDPYGKEGNFERMRREREQEGKELESEEEMIDPSGYVRATTIEGLEFIGGPDWGLAEWEAQKPFQGFMEPERSEDRKAIVSAIHRALVETYALKEAGLPLVMDYYSLDPTEDYTERVAEGASFERDGNGQLTLALESEELRRSILECVTPKPRDDGDAEETKAKEEDKKDEHEGFYEKGETTLVDQAEYERIQELRSQIDKKNDEKNEELASKFRASGIVPPDEEPLSDARSSSEMVPASNTWRDVSLEDAAIKFAVLKRVMQLTGRRIPDPDISVITTPTSLLVHLVKKPKPKKIAEVLDAHPVATLPNVQIKDKRYSPSERETEIGRWKLIQKELQRRGLPVAG